MAGLAFLSIAGFVLLYLGGEYLVKGAANLALSLGISAGIIGLTIVSAGTSSPELVVSLLAALNGKSAISLGNIVGSNLANIGVIVGLTAIVRPIPIHWTFLRVDMPVMLLAFFLYYVFAVSGTISRGNGAVLLAIFFIYLIYYTVKVIKSSRKNRSDNAAAKFDSASLEKTGSPLKNVAWIVLGTSLLILGGHILVESATKIATIIGISQWVIALSMVAVGTSLPELTTSLVAAVRGHSEIVIGNVIGSNIFNVLFVQSTVGVIQPIPVQWSFITFEFPVMLAAAVILFFILRTNYLVSRLEGVLLFTGYILVILYAFLRNPIS